MLAAVNNDPDILTVLLEADTDLSMRNAAGQSAADIAAELGNREALALLVSR